MYRRHSSPAMCCFFLLHASIYNCAGIHSLSKCSITVLTPSFCDRYIKKGCELRENLARNLNFFHLWTSRCARSRRGDPKCRSLLRAGCPLGLVVWFSLRVREVPSSILGVGLQAILAAFSSIRPLYVILSLIYVTYLETASTSRKICDCFRAHYACVTSSSLPIT